MSEAATLEVLWVAAAFLLGALPFSVWVGRWRLGKDIRQYGDHNPGATNVMRAGSKTWGVVAVLLDVLKGALPVGLAHFAAGFEGWALVPIALAPVLGHAYSPFLGWRGGKAVAVTGGVWCGLTIWEGPTIMGLLLGLWVWLIAANGWAVLLTMLSWLAYLLLTPASFNLLGVRPDLVPTLLAIWAGNFLILAWKHRADLRTWPGLRRRMNREAQA